MKQILVFAFIIAELLVCSSDASAAKLRGKQVVKQKTVVRQRGRQVAQNSININTGFGVQRSFVRQRSFVSAGYAVPMAAQAVYAAPVQAQVFAVPVYQPMVQQAIVQQQVYTPVIQAAPIIQAAPVYAPSVQFDVAPICVAPAAIVRQRTVIRGY